MKKISKCLFSVSLLLPVVVFSQTPEVTGTDLENSFVEQYVEIPNSQELDLVIDSRINVEPDTRVRNTDALTPFNIFPFFLSQAIKNGLPAETIVLILMIPILTTLLVFLRNIVGVPSLDMLVIIALSIALLASGLFVGALLLGTILFSSMSARYLFSRVKIMQLPKISLQMTVVSFAVVLLLAFLAFSDLISVESISIVPILLLIILSERIVRLEFERKPRKVWGTVIASLVIGVFGYGLLQSETAHAIILNFPEIVLLIAPLNLIMGRYFGLRLNEYYRFSGLMNIKKK